MKKIIIIAILSLMIALLGANTMDNVMGDLWNSGDYDTVYDDPDYWVRIGNYEDVDKALDYIARASIILLYGRAGWDTPTDSDYMGMIENVVGVAAAFKDWDSDDILLCAISMDKIMDNFKDDSFRNLGTKAQIAKVVDYLKRAADFHAKKNRRSR